LEPGDEIVQIGNRTINSGSDVAKAVAGMHVGQTVPVEVSRGSTLVKTSAILGAPPSSSP
jgi:S1-C subfamily serine protease